MSICVSCVLRVCGKISFCIVRDRRLSHEQKTPEISHSFSLFYHRKTTWIFAILSSTLLHTRIVWITDDLWVSFSYSSSGSLFCCRNLHERAGRQRTAGGGRMGVGWRIWFESVEYSSWNWSVNSHTSKCETVEQLIADSWDGWFFFQCFIYISTSQSRVFDERKRTQKCRSFYGFLIEKSISDAAKKGRDIESNRGVGWGGF